MASYMDPVVMVSSLLPGDMVGFTTPHGQTLRGRVLIASGTHASGIRTPRSRHGTPFLVTPSNIAWWKNPHIRPLQP